jgi:NADH:ubiquinone oxidoreductase subunit F (NADH-binding)
MFGSSLKITALAVAALAGFGGPGGAQMVCGERKAVVAQLEGKYGETRRSIGVHEQRGVVEVYASDTTGTWTILVTNTEGKSCLMAAGEGFESLTVAGADAPI